jgi:hypothetical protein
MVVTIYYETYQKTLFDSPRWSKRISIQPTKILENVI